MTTPPCSTIAGLDAALFALAARSHVPVHLDVRMDGAAALRQAQSTSRGSSPAAGQRAIAVSGGTFRLDSPQGGPSTLGMSVPCAF